jgi:hypothetical protein
MQQLLKLIDCGRITVERSAFQNCGPFALQVLHERVGQLEAATPERASCRNVSDNLSVDAIEDAALTCNISGPGNSAMSLADSVSIVVTPPVNNSMAAPQRT